MAYALRGERGGCVSPFIGGEGEGGGGREEGEGGERGRGHMHFVVNEVGGVFPFMWGGGEGYALCGEQGG